MTGHAGACTLHADSPEEALRRLATLLGSEKGVSPHDATRMIASSVDLLVQINIIDEVRRVTAIARLEKHSRDEDARITPLWRYDEQNSTPAQPRWLQVEETEKKS
jgi:pilus assembly protein CpaF